MSAPRFLAVCVICRNDQGEMLMGYNLKRRGWEFAGGKVEDGETFLAAAERELLEETGCTAKDYGLSGYFDADPAYLCLIFEAVLVEAPADLLVRPREPKVHARWIWFNEFPYPLSGPAALAVERVGVSYEQAERSIKNLPMTWIPAMLRTMVNAGYDKGVFVPGGASSIVQQFEHERHSNINRSVRAAIPREAPLA